MDEVQTIHNTSNVVTVSVPSSTRTKKSDSFLSLLLKTFSSSVIAAASSGQARSRWGWGSTSAQQEAQGEAPSTAPLPSALSDQLHHPKGFLEIIPYLLLPAAAAGVHGSNNFHKHILPLGLESDSFDRDPQCPA